MAIDYAALTADERTRLEGFRSPKKGRYGNVAKRTEYAGVSYDSKFEAEYAAKLDALKAVGEVAWSLRQVKVPLGADFSTRIDFVVARQIGAFYVFNGVEVKGVETREFAKVRKLWPKYGPFPLHVIKRGEVEIIEGCK